MRVSETSREVLKQRSGARSRNRTGTSIRTGDFKSKDLFFKNSSLALYLLRSETTPAALRTFVSAGSKIVAVQSFSQKSLGWSYLFADPLTDVVLGHHDRCMPQLVTCLENVATRFCLVSTRLGAQVAHLKVLFLNTCCFTSSVKPSPQHAACHWLTVIHHDQSS